MRSRGWRSARAMRWRITSESDVDWKMAPRASSSLRSASALTRFPLWPSAIEPRENDALIGWAFRSVDEPAVE